MSDNQERIDELMKKLDLLINQQATFSREIDHLKNEIQELNPDSKPLEKKAIEQAPIQTQEVEQPKIFANSVGKISWTGNLQLNQIKEEGLDISQHKTKAGTGYIKFYLDIQDKKAEICITEKGKWMLGDESGNVLLNGRIKGEGTTLSIESGKSKNTVIQGKILSENILAAANLSSLTIQKTKPSDKSIQEPAAVKPVKQKGKSNIEKFVGENLITVIGVIIILIGVVFGVKYSIDHNLMSPLTRIILGYLLGTSILLIGIKLKAKYEQFSAVMVSGAMAILYFLTFAAYSFFDIFPQLVAFGLMVFFTIFTVVAAISYNRQLIAHIGLVGSYAVPFLLSDGSGNVLALFSYMTIINAGILIIAFKRHWKPLYYVAFGSTWLIFGGWYAADFSMSKHFEIAFGFATAFFIMFYTTFLSYKLLAKEKFLKGDIIMIILNSTIFYAICYNMLDRHTIGVHYLGLFTVATGVIHFIVSVILFKTKLADRNLFYLTSGMVLGFITIAIPVQLEGTWVTLLWGVEAAILFWIGRTKSVSIYERLSYPVMVISLVSLINDWITNYDFYAYNNPFVHYEISQTPFWNITFGTSIIIAVSFGIILYVSRIPKYSEIAKSSFPTIQSTLSYAIPAIFIVLIYFIFKFEMDLYWDKMKLASEIITDEYETWTDREYNRDITIFKTLWAIMYSIVFITILIFINEKKIKSKPLQNISAVLSVFVIITFLTIGILLLGGLRDSYTSDYDALFEHGAINVGIRYICYGLLALLMYRLYKWAKEAQIGFNIKLVFDLFMHTVVLWVLSAELINILILGGSHAQDKLGISILWGIYAIILIILGIWKKKAHLRIASMCLLGITLVKLFFYDLTHLSTIAKTVVFITLGIIILIISFMYNKYKHLITDEEE
jgi:hypothetical protein